MASQQVAAYSRGIAPFYQMLEPGPPAQRPDVAYLLAHGAPTMRVLDIGAGTGHVAAGLAMRGCNVDALEPDADMHAAMLINLHGWFAGGACRVSPMQAASGLALPSSSYDMVCCLAVLHLLTAAEQAQVFRYAAEMLAPGGRLIVEVPVATPMRCASSWSHERHLAVGQVTIDHWVRLQRASAREEWLTGWRFQVQGSGGYRRRISRRFRWTAHPAAHYVLMAASCGLRVCQMHADFENAPWRDGVSTRAVLVIARRLDRRRSTS